MAQPRKKVYDKNRKGTYHCTARCVRRSRLCGRDPDSGKDYTHRRTWIQDRLAQFAALFMIDVEFHSELSNHLHLILRTQPRLAKRLPAREAAYRYLKATKLAKWTKDGDPEPDERKVENLVRNKKKLKKVRKRLASISWFMGLLCESIARRANKEDECTGHFWEGRFRSRECLDHEAVLLCAAYVDLNPLRAGEVDRIDASRYTSLFQRLAGRGNRKNAKDRPDRHLAKLTRERDEVSRSEEQIAASSSPYRASDEGCIYLSLDRYVELLRATVRLLRNEKRTTLPRNLIRLLEPLGIDQEGWMETMTDLGHLYCHVIGRPAAIEAAARRMGVQRLKGINAARRVFRA